MRPLLFLSVLYLPLILGGAQIPATHTESAMQCIDTTKRNSLREIVITNTCNFKIRVQASTAAGTQLARNLDSGDSDSIATSDHNPWRVFSGTWPGSPKDAPAGTDVTYATVNYECDTQTASAPIRQPSSDTDEEMKMQETKLYSAARPYMDEDMPNLKKTVHELSGLKPDPGQQQLSALMVKVGAAADDLLKKIPNLVSDEQVNETQRTVSRGAILGCVGASCVTPGSEAQKDQKFSYIILTHPAEEGRLLLEEYRTGRNDKPITQGTAAPHFQGFASAWIFFSSLNQVESRFRYLGQQKMDKHETFVVAFAQAPGAIEHPGEYMTTAGPIPMLLQGIAWIDQSDFRIVRLRTDLLAPQPQVDFQRQMSNILFGPVRIPVLDSELWLPQDVDVEMEANGQYLQEQHRYSKYRLYEAKTKIVPLPNQ
jgi:hypothetical protein